MGLGALETKGRAKKVHWVDKRVRKQNYFASVSSQRGEKSPSWSLRCLWGKREPQFRLEKTTKKILADLNKFRSPGPDELDPGF